MSHTLLFMAAGATFGKQEHIVSKKLIERLFQESRSHSVLAFPLRAVYLPIESSVQVPVQVLISVPKKHLKHAVDRNRVKRQVREAYRQNKQLLWSAVPEGRSLALAFVWLSDETVDSPRVERSVKYLLHRLAEQQLWA